MINLPRFAIAVAAVYVLGYVAGALLVAPSAPRGNGDVPREQTGSRGLAWAGVRTLAGLLLTTLAFLASLLISLPWFAGPVVVVLAAIARYRAAALAPPSIAIRVTRGGVVAGLLSAALVAPILVSAARMAPGPYPPVFYHVDTPYFLEKVHALVKAEDYPPQSLSNAGGRQTYHFAGQGMAALIARASGLPPHQALFALVLPLLTLCLIAAAVAAAGALAPQVSPALAVPLLIVPVPSFWYAFSQEVGPALVDAVTSATLAPLLAVADRVEMWGAASVVAHNVAAHALVLAALAAIATAPSRGWRLATFLIGATVMMKVSTGIALVAGFGLAQAYAALVSRRWRAVLPAAGAVSVFLAAYAAFFLVPDVPVAFTTELTPLFHATRMADSGRLDGVAADFVWLCVPIVLAWTAAAARDLPRTVPLLILALTPFLIVNTTASFDQRHGAGNAASDDWMQILIPVAVVMHALALAVINTSWPALGRGRRAVVAAAVCAAMLPSAIVSTRYAVLVARNAERGHEFVDNRAIGEALAAIPVEGTLIVTNDLRYPAEDFRRDEKQMQVPALFGHQAFAVNYKYERYPWADERGPLQKLLEAPRWTPAIDDAARRYGWTHLLIHKPFVHPEPVPLERVFENGSYTVFRFPR